MRNTGYGETGTRMHHLQPTIVHFLTNISLTSYFLRVLCVLRGESES